MKPSIDITCDIDAPDAATGADLAHIVTTCARETGLPVRANLLPAGGRDQTITLHLPAELAATQHPVWCLACRLACFCPAARVSVFIPGAHLFSPPALPASRQSA
jgi:hypothetical protein